MRRREAYALKTKQNDPKAYETSHDPLASYAGGPVVMMKPGWCAKCGKHIGRGIAFHVKKCNGE